MTSSKTRNVPAIGVVVAVLCCTMQQAGAQAWFAGACPSPAPVAYNAALLTGTWYEVRRYDFALETLAKCVAWTFTETTTGTLTANTVITRLFGSKTMTSTLTRVTGSTNADFNFRITKLPGLLTGWFKTLNMKVLAVNADYMILWSCSPALLKNSQLLWVLTRSQAPPATVITGALTTVAALGLNTNSLITVSPTC
ncbi:uncharacterized protein LOC108674787 [Hyalella azteca]|uniref:Uncharacterized protein LOC108674787 n=1 Tax=Hyalella azteca TaxID=294128 RepID=A0A8B7NWX9_HYAAZ|nr:uncharacterized protein LOC108674787 [Hyalella azteca]